MITAKFQKDYNYATAYGLWQYDYGQILRIEGLQLPTAVEIHFALQPSEGVAETRVGTIRDGATEVAIPDSILENDDATFNYDIYVFIYLVDTISGQTEYRIKMPVKTRPKPSDLGGKEPQDLFREAIQAVNDAAAKAETSETLSRSYAVGDTGTREGEETDNAKYYAHQAEDSLRRLEGATTEAVKDGKKEIEQYVQDQKTTLKGDTGNVYFAAFSVKEGRLKMYSDPKVDKVCFKRKGSRLAYKLRVK